MSLSDSSVRPSLGAGSAISEDYIFIDYPETKLKASSDNFDSTSFQEDTPSHRRLQRVLLVAGTAHTAVTLLGIVLLSVFGITISGALLVACTCFLAFATLLQSFLDWCAQTTTLTQKMGFLGTNCKRDDLAKIILCADVVALILGIATVVHGAVVLGQLRSMTPDYLPYMYNSLVSYLYIGLGSANLALGIAATVVEGLVTYRLLMFRRTQLSQGKVLDQAASEPQVSFSTDDNPKSGDYSADSLTADEQTEGHDTEELESSYSSTILYFAVYDLVHLPPKPVKVFSEV